MPPTKRGAKRSRKADNQIVQFKATDEINATDRAEKLKWAARFRRDKESELLSELADLLPYPPDVTKSLDKGAIMRLTISYLQMKNYSRQAGYDLLERLMGTVHEGVTEICSLQDQEGRMMLDALDAFLIVVNRSGRLIYVSEHVTQHLGYKQVEMVGHNIMDYVHPEDHLRLARQMAIKPTDTKVSSKSKKNKESEDLDTDLPEEESDKVTDPEGQVTDRLFYIRMKRKIVRRRRNSKLDEYMPTQVSGRLKIDTGQPDTGLKVPVLEGLVALCRPICEDPILEVRVDSSMFVVRFDMSMSVTFIDNRVKNTLGYEPQELLGSKLCALNHPDDRFYKCGNNRTLMKTGSSISGFYRLLAKNGQYVWLQTRYNLVFNIHKEPQYIIATSYVVDQKKAHWYLSMREEHEGYIPIETRNFVKGVCEALLKKSGELGNAVGITLQDPGDSEADDIHPPYCTVTELPDDDVAPPPPTKKPAKRASPSSSVGSPQSPVSSKVKGSGRSKGLQTKRKSQSSVISAVDESPVASPSLQDIGSPDAQMDTNDEMGPPSNLSASESSRLNQKSLGGSRHRNSTISTSSYPSVQSVASVSSDLTSDNLADELDLSMPDGPPTVMSDDTTSSGRRSANFIDNILNGLSTLSGPETLSFLQSSSSASETVNSSAAGVNITATIQSTTSASGSNSTEGASSPFVSTSTVTVEKVVDLQVMHERCLEKNRPYCTTEAWVQNSPFDFPSEQGFLRNLLSDDVLWSSEGRNQEMGEGNVNNSQTQQVSPNNSPSSNAEPLLMTEDAILESFASDSPANSNTSDASVPFGRNNINGTLVISDLQPVDLSKKVTSHQHENIDTDVQNELDLTQDITDFGDVDLTSKLANFTRNIGDPMDSSALENTAIESMDVDLPSLGNFEFKLGSSEQPTSYSASKNITNGIDTNVSHIVPGGDLTDILSPSPLNGFTN